MPGITPEQRSGLYAIPTAWREPKEKNAERKKRMK